MKTSVQHLWLLLFVMTLSLPMSGQSIPELRRTPKNLDILVRRNADNKYFFFSKDEIPFSLYDSDAFRDIYFCPPCIVVINDGQSYVMEKLYGEFEYYDCIGKDSRFPTISNVMAIDSQKEKFADVYMWMTNDSFINLGTWLNEEARPTGPNGQMQGYTYGLYTRDGGVYSNLYDKQSVYDYCHGFLAIPWDAYYEWDPELENLVNSPQSTLTPQDILSRIRK